MLLRQNPAAQCRLREAKTPRSDAQAVVLGHRDEVAQRVEPHGDGRCCAPVPAIASSVVSCVGIQRVIGCRSCRRFHAASLRKRAK